MIVDGFRRIARPSFAAFVMLCVACGIGNAQTRLGEEFRINSYTEGNQTRPGVASDGAGNFVVVWSSAQDGSNDGVFGQRFDSDGNAVGTEFQANTYTIGAQNAPRVAQDPTGAFVVSWTSVAQDGSNYGVFARRFDSDGLPVGAELQVNTYTPGPQGFGAVGVDPGGNFTIAWQGLNDGSSYGIFGQRFDSDGTRLGANFQANTYTPGLQKSARIAVLDSGDFVVAWNGTDSRGFGQRFASNGTRIGTEITLTPSLFFGDTGGLAANPSTGAFLFAYDLTGVEVRRFTSSGAQIGSFFQVDDIPFGNVSPQVARTTTDEFVVAWTNYDTTCTNTTGAYDGGSCGIFARTYDASAQPLTSGFQVNSYTLRSQYAPQVAWTGGDEFVAVWTTQAVDGCGESSGLGIFGQRFDSSGSRLGTEYQINEYTPDSQQLGAVAADPFGGFAVAWYGPHDGEGDGVWGRRYDSAGAAVGAEFQVNTTTVGDEQRPFLAGDPAGNFVAAWTGGFVVAFAQRFDGGGSTLGTEFLIHPYSDMNQRKEVTAVAADAAGDFVVVWDDYGDGFYTIHGEDGGRQGIFGQRYDSSGAPLGSYFQVNTFTPGPQFAADVAMRADGAFVAAWEEGDGDSSGIFCQRFASSGAKLGTDFQVNVYTYGPQDWASVGMDAAGNFVVAWEAGQYAGVQDGDLTGIVARRFDSSGAPLGGEFVVNTYTTLNQVQPKVAVSATGEFTIAWQSADQDGSSYLGPGFDNFGIFAQRYASSGAPAGTEFQVNTYTFTSQLEPRITYDAAGNFVVVYESYPDGCGAGGNTKSIAGQRFRFLPSPTRTVTPTATITPTSTPTPVLAVCAATPVGGCATPGKAILKMQDKGTKKLLSKWANGTVAPGGFGDPTGSTSYRLCVYDDGALIMQPLIDAGFAWQPTAKGFKYAFPAGNADGIYKVILKSGTGNAKILVKGKGGALSLPFPAGVTQSTAVTAQLVKDAPSGSECWQAVFTPPNGGSDSEKFKDKLP